MLASFRNTILLFSSFKSLCFQRDTYLPNRTLSTENVEQHEKGGRQATVRVHGHCLAQYTVSRACSDDDADIEQMQHLL